MTHLIISTEYYMNTPSVFILSTGQYYGCKIYPSIRNYPQSVDYWQDATSSDSDRYFTVIEVNMDDEKMNEIKKLQSVIEANESMIVRKSYATIKREWSIKRGKKYDAWKIASDAQSLEIQAEQKNNEPFSIARSVAFRQLRNLLLSLKN